MEDLAAKQQLVLAEGLLSRLDAVSLREQDLHIREVQVLKDEIDLVERKLGLTEEEKDIAEEQAEFYKTLYERIQKKPNRKWWCLFLCR